MHEVNTGLFHYLFLYTWTWYIWISEVLVGCILIFIYILQNLFKEVDSWDGLCWPLSYHYDTIDTYKWSWHLFMTALLSLLCKCKCNIYHSHFITFVCVRLLMNDKQSLVLILKFLKFVKTGLHKILKRISHYRTRIHLLYIF